MGEVGRLFLFMFQSSADFPGPWSLPINRHCCSDLSPHVIPPFPFISLYSCLILSGVPESISSHRGQPSVKG